MQQAHPVMSAIVPWVATGFGGGIARCQAVCGAISGGVIAIGLSRAGQSREQVLGDILRDARHLYRSFEEAFQHTDCRHLTGFDFSAPGGYEAFRQSNVRQERCHRYVRFVMKYLWREAQEGA